MTFSQVLKSCPLPKNETEILFTFLLSCDREFLLTHPEVNITPAIYKKFTGLVKKRLAGWSVAVLVGYKEFYGLDFFVDENVLVPRPETELIVDEVLGITKKSRNDLMLVDLGTGSGAIIISIASEIKKTSPLKYEKTVFRAIDISLPALKVAKKNSVLNKQDKKIKFLKGNLLEPLVNKNDFDDLLSHELIIAANLPYLTPNQVKTSPSIQKEPRLALVAGSDGLKYYRELFKQIKEIKSVLGIDSNPNKPITILCEIDPSQTKSVKLNIKKYFPLSKIELRKDLAGRDRLVIIKL